MYPPLIHFEPLGEQRKMYKCLECTNKTAEVKRTTISVTYDIRTDIETITVADYTVCATCGSRDLHRTSSHGDAKLVIKILDMLKGRENV